MDKKREGNVAKLGYSEPAKDNVNGGTIKH